MSGFTGAPTSPVIIKDTETASPFSSLQFADLLGLNESITVTLSFDPNTNYYYGPAPTSLGTLVDPLGGGTFSSATNTFTALATVTGTPTPASQILDRLVYTPPALGNGASPSIIATVSVTSTDPATGISHTATAVAETLQIVTPPSITGTVANQPVASGMALDPFGPVQVFDDYYGQNPSLSLAITITDGGVATDADGLLTGPGLSKTGVGTYTINGPNANGYYLNNLVFTTTAGLATTTASFTLAATDTATGYTTTDHATSVQIIGTSPSNPPPGPNPSVVELTPGQNYTASINDTVLGSSGANTVNAATGQVTVVSGGGALAFIGGTRASSVTGGAGSSTIFGGSGGGYYTGGRAGFNVLISQGASGANTTLTGSGAGDQIFGSSKGNDILIAGSGRDSILGGGGHTSIQGGAVASVIFTGGGTSVVNGSLGGADTIVGGTGSLNVNAQMGDAIFGGGGALNVTGSKSGADSIVGGSGALEVNGQGGNMLVVAGSATSTIQVGNGASLVFSAGATSLAGGTGSLQLVLGSGTATINEGTGAATYDVIAGSVNGHDILNGFRPGTDQIQLFGYSAAQQSISVSGGSTLIDLSDGTKIQVTGVTDIGSSLVG